MASVMYNEFKRASAAAEIDLDAVGDTINAILVMSNFSVAENNGMVYVGDLTTLDECDDSGSYARQTLASQLVRKDDANGRAEFDANDISFTGLNGDATRDYLGVLIYKHVTNDADSPLITFVEFSNQPLAKEATQVDVPWNAEGILNLT